MTTKKETNGLIEYLHRKADYHGRPFSGTFELTPVCNMRCNMCYIRQTQEELEHSKRRLLSVDEWVSLADKMYAEGTLLLLLTGGEPLTYPGFRELYTKLRNMGFLISINTNATLIDEEMVEWLAHNPPHRINITLYGASDETYNRLCHYPQGFTRTTHAIDMLQKRGMNVKLNCSVTPDNVHDLEKVIAYSDERELVLQASSYMFPPLRRDAESVGVNARFSPEECAITEARIRMLQRGRDNLEDYLRNIELLQPLQEDACFDCEGDRIRCRAGKSSFWITWDGRMLLCAMMDEPQFFPLEEGFSSSWEKMKKAATQIRLPAECAVCEEREICRSCAAMVYTETGSYDKKPQYRCDLMRAAPKACYKVLEECK